MVFDEAEVFYKVTLEQTVQRVDRTDKIYENLRNIRFDAFGSFDSVIHASLGIVLH